MKEKVLGLFKIMVMAAIILSGTMLQATETQSDSEPVAYVPETVFISPDTVDGTNIVHDFIIQNNGTAVLNIHKGTSACGYTVSSVPKPIPPGGEGIVSVTFSTYGGGGTTQKKTVTVITDDPNRPRIPLTIKARIIKPYTLSPESVKLKGSLGKPIKRTLNIAPTGDNPFTIQEIIARRGRNIRFNLEKIKKRDRMRYRLTVENTATTPGIYFDTLYVKTDSDLKPVIPITVIGKIK
jgi:hypothetical protein